MRFRTIGEHTAVYRRRHEVHAGVQLVDDDHVGFFFLVVMPCDLIVDLVARHHLHALARRDLGFLNVRRGIFDDLRIYEGIAVHLDAGLVIDNAHRRRLFIDLYGKRDIALGSGRLRFQGPSDRMLLCVVCATLTGGHKVHTGIQRVDDRHVRRLIMAVLPVDLVLDLVSHMDQRAGHCVVCTFLRGQGRIAVAPRPGLGLLRHRVFHDLGLQERVVPHLDAGLVQDLVVRSRAGIQSVCAIVVGILLFGVLIHLDGQRDLPIRTSGLIVQHPDHGVRWDLHGFHVAVRRHFAFYGVVFAAVISGYKVHAGIEGIHDDDPRRLRLIVLPTDLIGDGVADLDHHAIAGGDLLLHRADRVLHQIGHNVGVVAELHGAPVLNLLAALGLDAAIVTVIPVVTVVAGEFLVVLNEIIVLHQSALGDPDGQVHMAHRGGGFLTVQYPGNRVRSLVVGDGDGPVALLGLAINFFTVFIHDPVVGVRGDRAPGRIRVQRHAAIRGADEIHAGIQRVGDGDLGQLLVFPMGGVVAVPVNLIVDGLAHLDPLAVAGVGLLLLHLGGGVLHRLGLLLRVAVDLHIGGVVHMPHRGGGAQHLHHQSHLAGGPGGLEAQVPDDLAAAVLVGVLDDRNVVRRISRTDVDLLTISRLACGLGVAGGSGSGQRHLVLRTKIVLGEVTVFFDQLAVRVLGRLGVKFRADDLHVGIQRVADGDGRRHVLIVPPGDLVGDLVAHIHQRAGPGAVAVRVRQIGILPILCDLVTAALDALDVGLGLVRLAHGVDNGVGIVGVVRHPDGGPVAHQIVGRISRISGGVGHAVAVVVPPLRRASVHLDGEAHAAGAACGHVLQVPDHHMAVIHRDRVLGTVDALKELVGQFLGLKILSVFGGTDEIHASVQRVDDDHAGLIAGRVGPLDLIGDGVPHLDAGLRAGPIAGRFVRVAVDGRLGLVFLDRVDEVRGLLIGAGVAEHRIHAGVVGVGLHVRHGRFRVFLIFTLYAEVDRGAGDVTAYVPNIAGALALVVRIQEFALFEEVMADSSIVQIFIAAAFRQRLAAGVVLDGVIKARVFACTILPNIEIGCSFRNARRLVVVVALGGLVHGGIGVPHDGVGVVERLVMEILAIIFRSVLGQRPHQALLGRIVSVLGRILPAAVPAVGRQCPCPRSIVVDGDALRAGAVGAGGAHLLVVAHFLQGVARVHLRVGELFGDAVHGGVGDAAEQQRLPVLQGELGGVGRNRIVTHPREVIRAVRGGDDLIVEVALRQIIPHSAGAAVGVGVHAEFHRLRPVGAGGAVGRGDGDLSGVGDIGVDGQQLKVSEGVVEEPSLGFDVKTIVNRINGTVLPGNGIFFHGHQPDLGGFKRALFSGRSCGRDVISRDRTVIVHIVIVIDAEAGVGHAWLLHTVLADVDIVHGAAFVRLSGAVGPARILALFGIGISIVFGHEAAALGVHHSLLPVLGLEEQLAVQLQIDVVELALPALRCLVPLHHQGALRTFNIVDEDLEIELLVRVDRRSVRALDGLRHQQGGVHDVQTAVVAQIDVHDDAVPGAGRGADGGHVVVVGRAGDVVFVVAPVQILGFRLVLIPLLRIIVCDLSVIQIGAALALDSLGQTAHPQAAGLGADHILALLAIFIIRVRIAVPKLFERPIVFINILFADVVLAAALVARLAVGQIRIVRVLAIHVVPHQHIAVGDVGGLIG